MDEMNEMIVKDDAELAVFGGVNALPVIKMFDGSTLPIEQIINIVNGETKSVSEVLNQILDLQGFGGCIMEALDDATGETVKYKKYFIVTDVGIVSTTSIFIGRTLQMLYRCNVQAMHIKFRQVEKQGKRHFYLDLVTD